MSTHRLLGNSYPGSEQETLKGLNQVAIRCAEIAESSDNSEVKNLALELSRLVKLITPKEKPILGPGS